MFKKRFFLALALAGLSFGNALQASNTDQNQWSSIFDANTLPGWNFIECTGGGTETFANLGSSASSYAVRTWTGNNGIVWNATDARTDQDLTGDAIALRTGILKNTTAITGGIGTLSFNYQRVFTGNSTLKVFVNGIQHGGDIIVSATTTTAYIQTINAPGNATIEIRNTGNRTIIDDISWTCYSTVAGPELQLTDAANTNKDCGAFTIDFGSAALNQSNEVVFNIKNTGTTPLVVSALNLSDTTNFTIVSPATTSFTVAPAATRIILVRYNAVAAGTQTATLTVASNDVSEASCVVSLTGTSLVPCVAPVVEDAGITVEYVDANLADIVVNTEADGYLAIVSTEAVSDMLPSNTVNYTVGDIVGGGTVKYVGDSPSFSVTGLNGATEYFIYVFAFNSTDCTGGPLYNTTVSIKSTFVTPVAPCIGGSETFANIGANASNYAVRTWTGDNGVAWQATDARTDQELTGDAIALRTGTLTNTTAVTGGIGTLSFNYKRVFTGNSTLRVLVNGLQYGGDVIVSSDSTEVFSRVIDVAGPVTIAIENSGNRTIIDDVSWNCYEVPNRPEIQLVDAQGTPKECGAFTVDLGAVAIGANGEASFSIKNQGSLPLDITNITISDNVNYTITSPVTPLTIASLQSQDVTVVFNGATAGVKDAVLTITSTDADEAACTVNFTANAQAGCVVAVIGAGSATVANESDSSADVTIAGITADAYLVLINEDTTVPAPVNGEVYTVGTTIGTARVVYNGTDAAFAVTGLDAETTYNVFVFAYNTENCIGGPAYSTGNVQTEINTTEAPCVGVSESFTNLGTNASSYAIRTWTGDNGVVWTASDARTDQELTGKAIALRVGTLKNVAPVAGGIGTLTFKYKRIFSGNSTLKIFVNGIQFGGDVIVSSETAETFSQAINVSGDVSIEIRNSGNRVIIDDLSWDCSAASSARKSAPVAVTNDVVVYPNPNNGQFQIDMAGDTADVAVYNSFGKLVLSKKVSRNETIDLKNAESGIYMVVITSGSSVSNKKIIVK